MLAFAQRTARLVVWFLLLTFTVSLSAPALEAAEQAKASDVLQGDQGDAGEEAQSQASQDEEEQDEDSGAAASEDEDDEDDGDVLFSRTPRHDQAERNRAIAALLGGLGVGLLGLTFGPIGFFLGGVLGAAVGYVIGKELFPDRYTDGWNRNSLSDPSYDAYYGQGGYGYPSTNLVGAEGSDLRALEVAYYEALEEYRSALRGSDHERTNELRIEYQQAYQALIRARAAGVSAR